MPTMAFPNALSNQLARATGDHVSPENKMLAHLPIVILASLHPMPVADAMPKLDIARECKFEGGIQPTQESCAADETQARNQLQNEWNKFDHEAKKQCYETSTSN